MTKIQLQVHLGHHVIESHNLR